MQFVAPTVHHPPHARKYSELVYKQHTRVDMQPISSPLDQRCSLQLFRLMLPDAEATHTFCMILIHQPEVAHCAWDIHLKAFPAFH